MEEEIEVAWRRLLEGEIASEILLGNHRDYLLRESEIINNNNPVKSHRLGLGKVVSTQPRGSREIVSERLSSQENEKRVQESEIKYTKTAAMIHKLEHTINDLKEKDAKTWRRIDTAEGDLKLLQKQIREYELRHPPKVVSIDQDNLCNQLRSNLLLHLYNERKILEKTITLLTLKNEAQEKHIQQMVAEFLSTARGSFGDVRQVIFNYVRPIVSASVIVAMLAISASFFNVL